MRRNTFVNSQNVAYNFCSDGPVPLSSHQTRLEGVDDVGVEGGDDIGFDDVGVEVGDDVGVEVLVTDGVYLISLLAT